MSPNLPYIVLPLVVSLIGIIAGVVSRRPASEASALCWTGVVVQAILPVILIYKGDSRSYDFTNVLGILSLSAPIFFFFSAFERKKNNDSDQSFRLTFLTAWMSLLWPLYLGLATPTAM